METTIHGCPVWITHIDRYELSDCFGTEAVTHSNPADLVGFYWAVCQPGCIPDSEFMGPFDSIEAAEADAAEALSY